MAYAVVVASGGELTLLNAQGLFTLPNTAEFAMHAAVFSWLSCILLLWVPAAAAQDNTPCIGSSASLSWQPVELPDSAVGYRLYYGTHDGFLDQAIDLGSATSHTFSPADHGLADGIYHFAVTAYDATGNGTVTGGKDVGSESPLSAQQTIRFCN